MATASISIMKSGPARRVMLTVVLVGVATPRNSALHDAKPNLRGSSRTRSASGLVLVSA